MLIAVPDLRALDTSQHQGLQSANAVLGWIPRRRARKNLCAAFDRLSIQMRGEHGGKANPVQGGGRTAPTLPGAVCLSGRRSSSKTATGRVDTRQLRQLQLQPPRDVDSAAAAPA